MAQLTFTIKFKNDPANIEQVLDTVDSSLKSIGANVEQVGAKSQGLGILNDQFVSMGLRLQGIRSIFDSLKATFGTYIEASNAAEAAETSLSQALKQRQLFTQATVEDLRAYAGQLQELTGIDDDLTTQTMAQLVAMGLQGEQLKKATALAQDLSVTMGTDLSGAARVLADAFNGQTGMLGRYIKGLDEADIKQRGAVSIIEQLERAVGGQAKAFGDTGAGEIQKFNSNLGDLQEKLGDVVKLSLVPFTAIFSGALKLLIDAPPYIHAVTLGVIAMATAFALLDTSLGGLPLLIGGLVTLIASLGVMFGRQKEETKGAGDAAREAEQKLANLERQIEALGSRSVGTTDKIDKLKEKIRELESGSKSQFLANELKAAEEESRKLTERYERASALLKEQLSLERQNKDLRTESAEKADEFVRIFSDGNKSEQEQLEDLKRRQIEAAQRVQELRLEMRSQEIEGGRTIAESRARTASEILGIEARTAQRIVEIAKDETLARIDNEEAVALTRATSEAERLQVSRGAAFERIAVELQAKDEILSIQEELIRSQLAKAKDGDRQKLEAQLRDLASQREAIASEAVSKVQGVEIEFEIKISDVAPEGSIREIENRISQIRREYLDARTDEEREAARKRLQIEQEALDKMDLSEEEQQERRRQRAREREELWRQENRIGAAVVSSIGAGFGTLWSNVLVDHRRAADLSDAVWLSMKNTALTTIGNILQAELERSFISTSVHVAGEAEKTAATQSGAVARVASVVWEAVTSVATWVWETAMFVAQQAFRTATVIAQGAIRIAQTLAEAAARFVEIVANAIASMGPLGFLAAPALVAAGIAAFAGVKSAFGFDKGGEIEEGETGFFEGRRTEIIAPKRTFVDIMRDEIVPMIVRTTQVVALQDSPRLAPAESGLDLQILRELRSLNRNIERKDLSVNLGAQIDGLRIVEKNLPEAERRISWRKK